MICVVPLSAVWCRPRRRGQPVHFRRREAVERLVWTLLVVEPEVAAHTCHGLGHRLVIVQVDLLVLDATPQVSRNPNSHEVSEPEVLRVGVQ